MGRRFALALAFLVALTAASPWGSVWYVDGGNFSSTGYWATAQWAATHAYNPGNLVRQLATPTEGNDRIFVEYAAACTSGASEPAWSLTQGAETNSDGTCNWIQVDGNPAVNGDTTNTPIWLSNKNAAVPKGLIIFDSVTSSLQIVTTSGTEGNGAAPSFSATAGVTTSDNTVTWTSLGLASNFTKWLAPSAHLSFSASITGPCDSVYVASEQTAETCNAAQCDGAVFAGTMACPNKVISVDKTNVPPQSSDYTPGATIGTNAAGVGYSIGAQTGNGSVYFSGMNISATGSVTLGENSSNYQYFENGEITLARNAADVLEVTGNTLDQTVFGNMKVKFSNAGQNITSGGASGVFEWRGGSVDSAGTAPTSLFNAPNSGSSILVHAVDVSLVTGTLVTGATNNNCFTTIFAQDKLGSGVSPISTRGTTDCGSVILANSDSGATGYRNDFISLQGAVTTNTTTFLKKGTGVAGIAVSYQFATQAGASFAHPLRGPRICQPSTLTSGSHTVTVQIAGAQNVTNAQMWMVVEYPGFSNSPEAAVVSTGLANPLTTPTTYSAPPASTHWNGSPADLQQMVAAISPQAEGNVCAQVFFAMPSATEYLDWTLAIK